MLGMVACVAAAAHLVAQRSLRRLHSLAAAAALRRERRTHIAAAKSARTQNRDGASNPFDRVCSALAFT